MTESNGTVNTLHREFSALLMWLQQVQQRCQEDNKTNTFNISQGKEHLSRRR